MPLARPVRLLPGFIDTGVVRIRNLLQQILGSEPRALQHIHRAEHTTGRQRRHEHGGLRGTAEPSEVGCDRGATRPLRPVRKHPGDARLLERSFERKQRAGAGLKKATIARHDGEIER